MQKILRLCMIGGLALGIGACADKDDITSDNPVEGSSSMEQYTAEESKLFLENTANEALTLLNPADQSSLIELCSYFTDHYGGYSLPETFALENNSNRYNLKNFFCGLSDGVRRGDGAEITGTAMELVYSLDLNNIKGIYEANDSRLEWEKTGNSNDVIFRFNNHVGETCELTLNGSSNTFSGSVNWIDNDSYYREDYLIDYRLPTEMSLTLIQGGAQMATAKIKSNFNLETHNFLLDINAIAANINTTCKMEATDTKITESTSTTVSGKNYMTTFTEANGNHICDISFYNRYFGAGKDNEAALSQLLEKGKTTVSVLGKVCIDGEINHSLQLWDVLDHKATDITTADKYVNILNSNVTGIVRFNNTTIEQARLKWDSRPTHRGDYEILPMLFFPDGTSYFFTSYFSSGFTSIENLWSSLVRKYASIWNSMQGLPYPVDPTPFKEYDYLLNMTHYDVLTSVPFQVSKENDYSIYYLNINKDHVADLEVLFKFVDEDNIVSSVLYNKAVMVRETVRDLSYEVVYKYFKRKYGNPREVTIIFKIYDDLVIGSDILEFENNGKYIWLDKSMHVSYIDKYIYDQEFGYMGDGLHRYLPRKLMKK